MAPGGTHPADWIADAHASSCASVIWLPGSVLQLWHTCWKRALSLDHASLGSVGPRGQGPSVIAAK
jgi:hypothetical protein